MKKNNQIHKNLNSIEYLKSKKTLTEEERRELVYEYSQDDYQSFRIKFPRNSDTFSSVDQLIGAVMEAAETAKKFAEKNKWTNISYALECGEIGVCGYLESDQNLIKYQIEKLEEEEIRKIMLKQAKVYSKKDAIAEINRLKYEFDIK